MESALKLAMEGISIHCNMTYIYIVYTPILGSEIAVPGRDREQGRFRGSSEGARERSKGAPGEHGGAAMEQQGSTGKVFGLEPIEMRLAARLVHVRYV